MEIRYIICRIKKMSIHIFVCLIIQIIGVCPSSCQTPEYLNYNISNGLPGSIVYSAVEDENGIMWFGTDKGLACFDGARFHVYDIEDGLPDPEVLHLFLDSKDRMWISCFKKKPCYRFKGRIYNDSIDTKLKDIDFESGICRFFEDKNGSIWISGQSEHVYKYSEDCDSIIKYKLLESGAIQGFFDMDSLIFAVEQKFFLKLNHYPFNQKIWLHRFFEDFTFQGFGQIDSTVLLSFIDKSYLITGINHPDRIRIQELNHGGRVYVGRDNSFWLCSSKGAYRVKLNNGKGFETHGYLINQKINSMFEDSNNGLWYCSSGNGVYYLPKRHSTRYSLSKNFNSTDFNITSIHQVGDNIYFGDDESNIFKMNLVDKNILKYSSLSKNVLNRTRKILNIGDTLIIANDLGVYLFHNNKILKNYPKSFSAKSILYYNNNIYYGTSFGLYKHSLLGSEMDVLKLQRVTAIAKDNSDFIWIGGIGGLFCSSSLFQYNWGEKFNYLNKRILLIQHISNNLILAATPNDGLLGIAVDKGEIKNIKKFNISKVGRFDNIQNIFIDNNYKIWLSTNKGVLCIDQQSNVQKFDRSTGLINDDINDLTVVNDTLWTATVSGISSIPLSHTDSANFSTIISNLRLNINNIELTNRLLDSSSGKLLITIPKNATLIMLDISCTDYSNSGLGVNFCYIIKNKFPPLKTLTLNNLYSVINNFIDSKTDTVFTKSTTINLGVNIPPGKYEVNVYSINSFGVWSKNPARITFIKSLYWYQSIWVNLIFFSLLIGLIIYVIYTIIQNKRLIISLAETQLKAVKAQINPHFIGNAVNSVQQFFYPPDPNNASIYMELLSGVLRKTLFYSEYTFISLKDEVRYIDDYLMLAKQRFGKSFEYSIDISNEIDLSIPIPSLLLQPLIENAIIHGKSKAEITKVDVSFKKINMTILCQILDNGVGLKKSISDKDKLQEKRQSTGLEMTYKKLQIINSLYRIKASLTLEDITDKEKNQAGTLVTFTYIINKNILRRINERSF